MKVHTIKYLLLLLAVVTNSFSEGNRLKYQPEPFWVDGKSPRGYINYYMKGAGTAVRISEADSLAYIDAVNQVRQKFPRARLVSYNGTKSCNLIEQNNPIFNIAPNKYSLSSGSSTASDLPVALVEVYRKENSNSVILESPSENDDLRFSEDSDSSLTSHVLLSVPREYDIRRAPTPFTLGLRSAVVPGWGQVLEHDSYKGGLFFLCTAAGIALGVSSLNTKPDSTKSSKEIKNVSIVSFSGAGIIWLANVINAARNSDKVYR